MDLTDYGGLWKKYKRELKKRIGDIITALAVIFILSPGTWYEFGAVLGGTIALIGLLKGLWLKKLSWSIAKGIPKSFTIGAIIFIMWQYLHGWTIIFGLFAIAGWKIWQSWAFYKDVVQSGADMLTGGKNGQGRNQKTEAGQEEKSEKRDRQDRDLRRPGKENHKGKQEDALVS